MQYDILFQDFLLCSVCVGWVELYNKVAHQKNLMYIECAKQVAEKRSSDPYKDTSIILNELLADEAWVIKFVFFVSYEICGTESYLALHQYILTGF